MVKQALLIATLTNYHGHNCHKKLGEFTDYSYGFWKLHVKICWNPLRFQQFSQMLTRMGVGVYICILPYICMHENVLAHMWEWKYGKRNVKYSISIDLVKLDRTKLTWILSQKLSDHKFKRSLADLSLCI